MRGQEFALSAASALKTSKPAASVTADNRALVTLKEIESLLAALRRDTLSPSDAEAMMPLLISTRILLEAAQNKIK